MDMPRPSDGQKPLLGDLAVLVAIATVKLIVHLWTNGNYGYRRDELYFIDCAEHLSFGYVDHPPFTPLVAKAA